MLRCLPSLLLFSGVKEEHLNFHVTVICTVHLKLKIVTRSNHSSQLFNRMTSSISVLYRHQNLQVYWRV